jgi:hypothetical protein
MRARRRIAELEVALEELTLEHSMCEDVAADLMDAMKTPNGYLGAFPYCAGDVIRALRRRCQELEGRLGEDLKYVETV